jgi:hypothetical protein
MIFWYFGSMHTWREPNSYWLDRFAEKLTPEYWSDLFCRASGDVSRLRGSGEFDEFFAASAFAWWLQVRDGVDPDAEFTHAGGQLWVEIFGLHFPEQKRDREAAVHRFDRRVREQIGPLPFPITTQYASHKDMPMDGRLRHLAREVGAKLALQLASSDEAMVEEPVRVTAKRSQMDIVSVGTTDTAAPKPARAAFTEQMRKQLGEALNKLRKHDIRRGCVLEYCAGYFCFNPSKRPYTLKCLYGGQSLFASSDS